jgi:salicylate hydroxylase
MKGKIDGARVTVIGAGVAGLTVALALAQRGAQVQVLEQASALDQVGAGIQISPNGAVVLRALGLGDSLRVQNVMGQGVSLIDGLSGRQVLRLDIARIKPDHRPLYLHRADLIGMLKDAARAAGVSIELGAKVQSVDMAGARPVVTLQNGQSTDCDLLIGADGLKSILHQALNGVTAPFFTRQAAWRAVIPAKPGDAPWAEVHMGPGRHLVSYPIRAGNLRNIVAVEERGSWLAEGWSHQDDPVHLRAAFASFSPRLRGWLDQVTETGLWGLFRHPVARHWSRATAQGAAVILGDAAHPTLPFLAQGANMALEDAFVLADMLDHRGVNEGSLSAFQQERAARCRRIVDASTGNARLYHLHRPWRGPAHMLLGLAGAVAPKRMVDRYDWLWGHDVTATTDQASSRTQAGT